MSFFTEQQANGIPASDILARRIRRALAGPAIHLEGDLLHRTARQLGGFAAFVPSPRQPFQSPIASPIFLGVTCDKDSDARESHHFHPHQVEIYCVMEGALKIGTWLGDLFGEFLLERRDLLVVPPGSCHHLYEWLAPGLVYVFRSPNDVTGDAAKVPCNVSNHVEVAEAKAA